MKIREIDGHWELVSCYYLHWSKNHGHLKKSVQKQRFHRLLIMPIFSIFEHFEKSLTLKGYSCYISHLHGLMGCSQNDLVHNIFHSYLVVLSRVTSLITNRLQDVCQGIRIIDFSPVHFVLYGGLTFISSFSFK